jgi:hypothetical protein
MMNRHDVSDAKEEVSSGWCFSRRGWVLACRREVLVDQIGAGRFWDRRPEEGEV